MTEREDLLKRATEIVMHGRTITYPSITSAEHIRNVMAELALVKAFEELHRIGDLALKERDRLRAEALALTNGERDNG